MDMDPMQQKHEDEIFQAIQDLKDSIFGLKQPYTPYCYEDIPGQGYVFSPAKTGEFVGQLCALAREVRSYREELEPVLPLFFSMTVRLLSAICGSGDWVFVSFRKIAKTALKSEPDEESTLDRIVSSHRHLLDLHFPEGEFWADFDVFSHYMGRVDPDSFYMCVKHTVERYLDCRRLNPLDSPRTTQAITTRIHRLSAAIEQELRQSGGEGLP